MIGPVEEKGVDGEAEAEVVVVVAELPVVE
jgi:hypothetical protein